MLVLAYRYPLGRHQSLSNLNYSTPVSFKQSVGLVAHAFPDITGDTSGKVFSNNLEEVIVVWLGSGGVRLRKPSPLGDLARTHRLKILVPVGLVIPVASQSIHNVFCCFPNRDALRSQVQPKPSSHDDVPRLVVGGFLQRVSNQGLFHSPASPSIALLQAV